MKISTIFRYKKLIAAIIAGILVLVGIHYYKESIVKTSPEYAVEEAFQAITTGDVQKANQYINFHNLVAQLTDEVILQNRTIDSWDSSSFSKENEHKETYIHDVVQNLLKSIENQHTLQYSSPQKDLVHRSLATLDLESLTFHSYSMSIEDSVPIVHIIMQDSLHPDISYTIHIGMKKQDTWRLHEFIGIDTIVKKRLVDHKEKMKEKNKEAIQTVNKLVAVSDVKLELKDHEKPKKTEIELNNLSKEAREFYEKKLTTLFIHLQFQTATGVEGMAGDIYLKNTETQYVLKKIHFETVQIKELSLQRQIHYENQGDGVLASLITSGKVVPEVHITEVITNDNIYFVRE